MSGFRRIIPALLVFTLLFGHTGCWSPSSEPEVVVYTALDSQFSKPIFEDLTEATGIAVLPKFDTESFGSVDGIKGVQIGPGAIALARIPFSASSWARPAVKFWMAPFVVA